MSWSLIEGLGYRRFSAWYWCGHWRGYGHRYGRWVDRDVRCNRDLWIDRDLRRYRYYIRRCHYRSSPGRPSIIEVLSISYRHKNKNADSNEEDHPYHIGKPPSIKC